MRVFKEFNIFPSKDFRFSFFISTINVSRLEFNLSTSLSFFVNLLEIFTFFLSSSLYLILEKIRLLNSPLDSEHFKLSISNFDISVSILFH